MRIRILGFSLMNCEFPASLRSAVSLHSFNLVSFDLTFETLSLAKPEAFADCAKSDNQREPLT